MLPSHDCVALVVELVDTRDLKSLGVRAVPVQVRPGAPSTYSQEGPQSRTLKTRTIQIKAPWQSGYAADCKSVDLGSTPGGASKLQKTSLVLVFLCLNFRKRILLFLAIESVLKQRYPITRFKTVRL